MKVRGPEFRARIMCLKRRSQSGISVTSDPVTKLYSNLSPVSLDLQLSATPWVAGGGCGRMRDASLSADVPTEGAYDGIRVIQERSCVLTVRLALQALRDGCPNRAVPATQQAVTQGSDLSGSLALSSLLTLLLAFRARTQRKLAVLFLAMALGLSPIACRPHQPFVPEGGLLEMAADPNCPITFDEEVGEYQLVYDTVRNDRPMAVKYTLRFLPQSGQPLPSKRTKRFVKPSPEKLGERSEKLKSVRTFAEAQAALSVSEPILLEMAADPHSPIIFDERLSEFHLVFDTVRGGSPMRLNNTWWFSPFTGLPLPSRRSELFMERSPEDESMIQAKLRGLRTFAEVQAALGPADSVWTREQLRLSGNQRARHDYTNIAATLDVFITEHDDGSFTFTYYRKRKPDETTTTP